MPQFDLPEQKVNEMIDRARKHKALVLDLRGKQQQTEVVALQIGPVRSTV